jgi:hypothetical protein
VGLYFYSPSLKTLLAFGEVWSSYDRIWFSGPDKQEILKKFGELVSDYPHSYTTYSRACLTERVDEMRCTEDWLMLREFQYQPTPRHSPHMVCLTRGLNDTLHHHATDKRE